MTEFNAQGIDSLFVGRGRRILVGCAPCQLFSTYNQKNEDPKWQLLDTFADLIIDVLPDVVSMENVPRLLKFRVGPSSRPSQQKGFAMLATSW